MFDRFHAIVVDNRPCRQVRRADLVIATLAYNLHDPARPNDEDACLAVLSLVDIATGDRRRLWAGPGSIVAESNVAFSPDGQLVAASHFSNGLADDNHDEEVSTVVVDLTGRVLHHLEQTFILPCTNGTWISDRELACYREDQDDGITQFDVVTGAWQALTGYPEPYAWIPCGLITTAEQRQGDPAGLYTTNPDGTGPRPHITIPGPYSITGVDVRRST